MLPSILQIPFQSELQIEDIHRAIAQWMEENLGLISFTREVENDIYGWGEPHFMQELCSCGVFGRRKHALVPAGVIPGVIPPAGGVMDVILYQHKPASDNEPWTLCFAWVEDQLPHGRRNPPESSESAFLAFCCMLRQLELTDY